MTDSHPFFRLVWRLNALAFLGVALVVGSFASYSIASEFLRSRSHRVVDRGLETPLPAPAERGGTPDVPKPVLRVGQFTRADGAVFQAPLFEVTGRGGNKYISSVKEGGGTTVRNTLFFDSESGDVRRLFSDDKGRILDEDLVTRSASHWPKSRSLARVYIYVPTDTNGDGRLDTGDRQRIVVTRPDGSQPIVLAEDVERFGVGSAQDGREMTLSYFLRKGEELHYGEFDLTAFKPGRTAPVKVPGN